MTAQENPFKFGTVVDGDFFTDRTQELPKVQQMLSGHNHLVMISPRRYGKTSLLYKAIRQMNRPAVRVNLQMAISAQNLAALLLRSFFTVHPWERLKDAIKKFRVIPTLTYNPTTNDFAVSFGTGTTGSVALEDVLTLMNEKSDPSKRLIVVFDEFQEIANFEPGTDKLLRATMQLHENINYVFMGSQESMMTEMFESVKSPFFHFGAFIQLKKIPYDDFMEFLSQRLNPIRSNQSREDAEEILRLTRCHPFYTQQLAAGFWDLCQREAGNAMVSTAESEIMRNLSAVYASVWSKLPQAQKRILEVLSRSEPLSSIRDYPVSSVYSAISRMKKEGLVVREDGFELEDPFFALWIRKEQDAAAQGLSSLS